MDAIFVLVQGTFRDLKPRRRRRRRRGEIKDQIGRIIAPYVRFNTLYISNPSSAKQHHEIPNLVRPENENLNEKLYLNFHLECKNVHMRCAETEMWHRKGR